MALGVSDHDQRSGLHPANADVALVAVVAAMIGRPSGDYTYEL